MLTLRLAAGENNGLSTKLAFIKRCYLTTMTDPAVRRFAEEGAGIGNRVTQVRNLFNAIRSKVKYIPDPIGVEMTKSPSVIVAEVARRGHAVGDCDDHACLAYTLLKSIGIPAKLRVIWLGKAMPQHIYVIAEVGGAIVPFDTTRSEGFGSEVNYSRKEDY